MPVEIRPAHESDIPYLYRICLETGDSGKDATALFGDPYLIGQYYAAPYLFFQKECCFVAELDRVPMGYIIAAADTAAFNAWFDSEWLPILRRRYPPDFPAASPKERELVAAVNRPVAPPDPVVSPWMARYPAHLHIDLLPALQGKGCGRVLMERLWAALRERGVPGVHLGVGAGNQNAIAFYRKLGYAVLREESWGLVMGKELG
jgi:ribosomal protein S18 acetylase RimI-like enzyme